MMQLHKLCKYASELEWSGGRRGRAEAEGVGGGQRWVEKGKGGHTMTAGGSQWGNGTLLLMDYDQEQLGKSEGVRVKWRQVEGGG